MPAAAFGVAPVGFAALDVAQHGVFACFVVIVVLEVVVIQDAFKDGFVAVEGGAQVVAVVQRLCGEVEAVFPVALFGVEFEALVQGWLDEAEQRGRGFFFQGSEELLDFLAVLAQVVGLFGEGGLGEQAGGGVADADGVEDGDKGGAVAAVIVGGEGILPGADVLQAVHAQDGCGVVTGEVERAVVDTFNAGAAQSGQEVGDLLDEHRQVAQAVGHVEDGVVAFGVVVEDVVDGGDLFGLAAAIGDEVAGDGFAELVACRLRERGEKGRGDAILFGGFEQGEIGINAELLGEVVPHAAAGAEDDEVITLQVLVEGKAEVGGAVGLVIQQVVGFAVVTAFLRFAEEGDEFAGHGAFSGWLGQRALMW